MGWTEPLAASMTEAGYAMQGTARMRNGRLSGHY